MASGSVRGFEPSMEARLKRALGRLGRRELQRLLRSLYGKQEETKPPTKKQLLTTFLSAYAKDCSEGRPPPCSVASIELHAITQRSSTLQWSVYYLTPTRDERMEESSVEVQMFCKNFSLYLEDMCSFEMADVIHHQAHWICLHIMEGSASSSCYLVRVPPSPVLLLAAVKKKHLHMVMEALCMANHCCDWEEVGLTGRSAESLLDLVLNQSSQGAHSRYRLNKVDPNPLLAVRRRPFTQPARPPQDKVTIAAEEAFGTDPLPVLERFTFLVDSSSDGYQPQCKLKLAGSSVLEGVRECVRQGLVTLPVPSSLVEMTSAAKNVVPVNSS